MLNDLELLLMSHWMESAEIMKTLLAIHVLAIFQMVITDVIFSFDQRSTALGLLTSVVLFVCLSVLNINLSL